MLALLAASAHGSLVMPPVDNMLDAILAYNAAERLPSLKLIVAVLTDPAVAAVPEIQTITGLLASKDFNNTLLAPDDASLLAVLGALGMSAPADLVAPSLYTKDLLPSILLYHVLKGDVGPAAINGTGSFPTLFDK